MNINRNKKIMKKGLFIVILSAILMSCASYKSLNLNRLTTGMTKAQVEAVAGLPDRVLAVNQTENGYQEVLEYRTSRSEIYALEFWDDYLTGYEFLYDDVAYVPPMAPPMFIPDYGRPIIIIRPDNNRPNRPNRPGGNTRPPSGTRPPGNTRPPSGITPPIGTIPPGQRPPSNRPETRPAENVRPTTRPTENVRPTTRPAVDSGVSSSSSGRTSSRSSSDTRETR